MNVLIKGAFWTALGKYSNYFSQFIVLSILSRLLNPNDFGILGMVVVYTGFLNLLAEGGLTNAIIKFQNLTKASNSSIFWFSFFSSIIVYLFTFCIAPWIELFFEFEGLSNLIRVVGLGVIFIGLSVVPEGLLKKNLNFRKLTISDSLPSILSGSLSIIMAYNGFGVWSLATNVLSILIFKSILVIGLSKWIPIFRLKFSEVRKILSFSSYLIAFNSINYWARNTDNLIVGKFLGSLALGYYSQAYKLMTLPNQLITSVVNAVILPLMASYREDTEKMAALYLKVVELLSLITFLFGIVMVFNAETIVIIVWGNKWTQSAQIFGILSLMTILQPIVSTAGSVFTSTGNAKLLFRLGFFNALIMILGMLIGLYFFGTSRGIAIGYAFLYSLIVLPLTLFFVKKTLKIKNSDFLKSFTRPMVLLLTSITCIYIFDHILIRFNYDFTYAMLAGSITINLFLMLLAYKTRYRTLISKLD